MTPHYTYLSSIDFINDLTFDYVETYSFQRGTEYELQHDCLKTEKETGRKLRGMQMAVVSSGSDMMLKEGFHIPFKESANYLGMKYVGDVHCWLENDMLSSIL